MSGSRSGVFLQKQAGNHDSPLDELSWQLPGKNKKDDTVILFMGEAQFNAVIFLLFLLVF